MNANLTKQYMTDKAYLIDQQARAQKRRIATECVIHKAGQTSSRADIHNEASRRLPVPQPLMPRRAMIIGVLVIMLIGFFAMPTSVFAQSGPGSSNSLFPGDGASSFGLGIYYIRLGEYEWAVDLFSDMIEANPLNPSAYAARGTSHYFLANYEEAMADSEHALELAPHYAMPHWTIGDIYFHMEEFEMALEHYELYVELAGESPHPYVLAQIEFCR